jgi:hypothetical protein
MIRGFELFREHFSEFSDHFILIGGTACELTFMESGGFRVTKDIDILILLESMSREFANRFHEFIRSGNYQCYTSKDDARYFYRFIKPGNKSYPPQIELLSRNLLEADEPLAYTKLIDDDYVKSMSAIILGTEYYDFARSHRVMIEGIPCLSTEGLIVFKTAAYLNLLDEKSRNPDKVRGEDIRKHRNDVFRLIGIISSAARVEVPERIKTDMTRFIALFNDENQEWRAIGQSLRLEIDTLHLYRDTLRAMFE